MNRKEIGLKLKAIREGKKLSKRAIHLAGEIKAHQLDSIENGTKNYTIDTLIFYTEKLGANIEINP